MKKKELLQFLQCFTDDVEIMVSFDEGTTTSPVLEPEYSWKAGEQAKIVLHSNLSSGSLPWRAITFLREESLMRFVQHPEHAHNNDIDYLEKLRGRLKWLIIDCEKFNGL